MHIPVPAPPSLLCHPPCRGAQSCHPRAPLREVLPGSRGVNSQADTVPTSQLKWFCRWSVCPVGPVAQEKNHLIIFYFFLTLTPHHCNTSEHKLGNSEAAGRSRRCSELSRLICVSLLPPGLSEPHFWEGFIPPRTAQMALGEATGSSSFMCGGGKMIITLCPCRGVGHLPLGPHAWHGSVQLLLVSLVWAVFHASPPPNSGCT